MRDTIACTQCQGMMLLEDRGEMLQSDDVMTYFGYRCLSCGHVVEAQTDFECSGNYVVRETQREVQVTS